MKSTADIRRQFIEFFSDNGHENVPSSSLVPGNDKTLLFTNAGMVQFKDVFLGDDKRAYNRAVTSQRCVRAGGKHNDLENVGYTARHHTFFEMLGNFSFGDYFKQDAIKFAWKLLTEIFELPADKLLVTVYHSDDEAAAVWRDEIGLPEDKIIRIDTKDNFWEMGDTGPCGPCTEIFYDHGDHIWGGPPGSPEEDGDRFIEIWNLVFMQYEKDASGEMHPLPAPSVDTGMGLERIAAILQGVHSNYEIDLFVRLIKASAELTNTSDLSNNSLKVIADHIRSSAFLIVDGVLPSNDGRGYVLRRIIRRAIRHGYKLGQQSAFFHKLVGPLVTEMGDAYPELAKAESTVAQVLEAEEARFAETIGYGMELLETKIKALNDQTIPGEVIFKLYDTYGFPVDLTGDIARERGLTLDLEGYERCMEAQREESRSASKFGIDYRAGIRSEQTSDFEGYTRTQNQAQLVELYQENQPVKILEQGESGVLVLDKTPFYAESGGQVGDQGVIRTATGEFVVKDTQRAQKAIIHIGHVQNGHITLSDADNDNAVEAIVDHERRQKIRLNHSATHLLHAALRNLLGDHVHQKGSLVEPERLRFDFSHFESITSEQIHAIENAVNHEIRLNHAVQTRSMSFDQALEAGAMALFGEKYDDEVRTLRMGETSFELCGGTHVDRTGDIGYFRITSESGVSAGIRRLEAITGQAAIDFAHVQSAQLKSAAAVLKTTPDRLDDKLAQLNQQIKKQQQELQSLKQKLASGASQGGDADIQTINDISIITRFIDNVDSATLRELVDKYKLAHKKAVIVLATVEEGTVRMVAGVTKAESQSIKAGDVIKHIASITGARGGGRPDFAQAGGGDKDKINQALESIVQYVRDQQE